MAIKKIAILGAGNGGCAAAADLTLRGFQVRLFSRSESTTVKLGKLGEIELIEGGVSKKAAPFFVSPHLPPVVQGVDLIVVTTPAVGHEYLAQGNRQLFNRRSEGSFESRPHRRRAAFCQLVAESWVHG